MTNYMKEQLTKRIAYTRNLISRAELLILEETNREQVTWLKDQRVSLHEELYMLEHPDKCFISEDGDLAFYDECDRVEFVLRCK